MFEWYQPYISNVIKGLFEMSKICTEPITARCMLVRKVSELRPPCSDVMLTCAKKLSRWWGGCVGLRSCSPPTVLIKSMIGNDWLTTHLNAHFSYKNSWIRYRRPLFTRLEPCEARFITDAHVLFHVFWTVEKALAYPHCNAWRC